MQLLRHCGLQHSVQQCGLHVSHCELLHLCLRLAEISAALYTCMKYLPRQLRSPCEAKDTHVDWQLDLGGYLVLAGKRPTRLKGLYPISELRPKLLRP
jgi:hypothetical protein